MVGAVIFDFDGVLVDSERKKFKDLQSILKSSNLKLNKSDFQNMLGKKTGSFLSAKFLSLSESQIKKIVRLRRQKQFSNMPELIPGTMGLIKFLKSKKIKIAITTGSSRASVNFALKKCSAHHLFDLIVAGDEFKKSKPSPECYKLALKKLKISSKEVIVVEDSVAGIKAAKAAKCVVIGVMTYLPRKKLCSAKADFVFRSNADILRYFKTKGI